MPQRFGRRGSSATRATVKTAAAASSTVNRCTSSSWIRAWTRVEPARERRPAEELPAGLVEVGQAGAEDAGEHGQPPVPRGGPGDHGDGGQAEQAVRDGHLQQVLVVDPEVRQPVEHEVGQEAQGRGLAHVGGDRAEHRPDRTWLVIEHLRGCQSQQAARQGYMYQARRSPCGSNSQAPSPSHFAPPVTLAKIGMSRPQ